MQIPQIFQQFFTSRKPSVSRGRRMRYSPDLDDVPAMQARNFRPLEAPATIYSTVSSYIMNLPIPLRQQLMVTLYDQNMFMEHLTNRIINPILGKTGFVPIVPEQAPATKDVLEAFWGTDELTDIQQQERILRDLLIVGEVFDLIAPCGESFYTAPILPAQLEQTIVDPMNFHQICGVKQQVELATYRYHPLVLQERRLTPQALQLRKQWRNAGGYDCIALQNLKKTAPIPGNALEPSEIFQKRGEPFLTTTADLFKMLVNYLWTSLDRAQALNTFNWGFGVTLPDRLQKTGSQEEQAKYINDWERTVGTPKPNSAFFYPKDVLEPTPFNFPAGVASAMESLFKMMRNTVGWAGNSRDEDMGDSDSKFATMKQPGVSNPTIESLQMLQIKTESFHFRRSQYVCEKKAADGTIPRSEYEIVRGRPKFAFSISSPEISKQDFGVAATTMNSFEDSWAKIAARGVYTVQSLVDGERQMVNELYGIELKTDDAALKRLEAQQAAQPETPATPEENTDEEATE